MDTLGMRPSDPIWVEVLGRGREVTARHRAAGPVIAIGRAYDNDVVLDDPAVAPHHLRVARTADGALVAEDLGSRNGLRRDGARERVAQLRLDGDTAIRIGGTVLRIRDAGFVVPPEAAAERRAAPWAAAILLALVFVGVETLLVFLRDTETPKLTRYLVPVLGAGVAVLLWTTLWAVLGRIFGGVARFAAHLVIALAGGLFLSTQDDVVDAAAYAFAWTGPGWLETALVSFGLAAVAFLHLQRISHAHLAAKGIAVAGLAALAVGLQVARHSEQHAEADDRPAMRHLLPPALRLAPVRSASRRSWRSCGVRRRPAAPTRTARENFGESSGLRGLRLHLGSEHHVELGEMLEPVRLAVALLERGDGELAGGETQGNRIAARGGNARRHRVGPSGDRSRAGD